MSAINEFNPRACLQLGDIVDGNETAAETKSDFAAVLSTLKPLTMPILNTLGNHCLDVEYEHLVEKSNMNTTGTYYSYDLSSRWRLLVLDTVEVSVQRDPTCMQALEYLRTHEHEPNAKPWNGTISETQRAWLKEELKQARTKGCFIIVCGHLPLVKEAAIEMLVMWNHNDIVELLEEYKDTVKAYFAGHHHGGGYAERNRIHHVTFEGLIDSKVDDGAYAFVTLKDDEIVIEGYGATTSRKLRC